MVVDDHSSVAVERPELLHVDSSQVSELTARRATSPSLARTRSSRAWSRRPRPKGSGVAVEDLGLTSRTQASL